MTRKIPKSRNINYHLAKQWHCISFMGKPKSIFILKETIHLKNGDIIEESIKWKQWLEGKHIMVLELTTDQNKQSLSKG